MKSRTKRWQHAVGEALKASALLEEMLQELLDIQQEYSDWKDAMPENLENSALGEKLSAIVDLDIESAHSNAEEIVDLVNECDMADLPLGFGRD